MSFLCLFFFNDTATTEIYTLSLHDALPIYHSVLVIDVLETASLPEMPEEFEAKENDHQLVKDLYEIWDNLNTRNMLEDWHDAEQIRDEALELFSHGIVDLKTRAEIESMYWSVCHEINTLARSEERRVGKEC